MEDSRHKKITYNDVATRLRWEILNEDHYFPGRRLQPIRELATRFGCTTRTAGRALKELATEGLITIIPGRGSYVAGGTHDDKPRNRVEKYILSNTRPHTFLPTTDELARLCQVHPMTARRAIADLTRQGILRKNGRRHQRR